MQDTRGELESYKPDMGTLVNRAADNWKPLFAIADMVGGGWPERARKAASVAAVAQDSQTAFEETLAAIKSILDGDNLDEIGSEQLVGGLVAIEGGPWSEWGKAHKPITQNALARLLRPFKVVPGDIGPNHARRKGYQRVQFRDLFEAYLSPPSGPPPATTAHLRKTRWMLDKLATRNRASARFEPQKCAVGNMQKTQYLSHCARMRGCDGGASGGRGPVISTAAKLASLWSKLGTSWRDGVVIKRVRP